MVFQQNQLDTLYSWNSAPGVATPFGLASEATLHESIDKSVVEALFIDSIDLVH
jgi:hypothetical protein